MRSEDGVAAVAAVVQDVAGDDCVGRLEEAQGMPGADHVATRRFNPVSTQSNGVGTRFAIGATVIIHPLRYRVGFHQTTIGGAANADASDGDVSRVRCRTVSELKPAGYDVR